MASWTSRTPGCYTSWVKERKSCCTPTSGAPLDSTSRSRTWSVAALSQVKHYLYFRYRLLLNWSLRLWIQIWSFFYVQLMVSFTLHSGEQEGRLDLSHPVHVDNCLLEPETNQCWKEPPAFIHRDLRYRKIICSSLLLVGAFFHKLFGINITTHILFNDCWEYRQK